MQGLCYTVYTQCVSQVHDTLTTDRCVRQSLFVKHKHYYYIEEEKCLKEIFEKYIYTTIIKFVGTFGSSTNLCFNIL